MHYVSLDVSQEDCPLTRATRDHEATFTTPHWHFDPHSGRWDLRIHAVATDRYELGGALRALRDADSVDRFDLQSKAETGAFVRTTFEETTAIGTIDRHGGYVVGPFRNVSGTERWHLGFDTESSADEALSALDNHEEFLVRDRRRLDVACAGTMRDVTSGERLGQLTDGEQLDRLTSGERLGRLTDRERDVTETALELGYYESPRETTLTALGEELGVSDVAVSKTLRRAERKLLTTVLTGSDEPGN